jgi:hypothetical protein
MLAYGMCFVRSTSNKPLIPFLKPHKTQGTELSDNNLIRMAPLPLLREKTRFCNHCLAGVERSNALPGS